MKQAPERKEALRLQVEANRDTSLVFVSISPEFSSHCFLSVSLSYVQPLFLFGFFFPPFPHHFLSLDFISLPAAFCGHSDLVSIRRQGVAIFGAGMIKILFIV